ncbi:MAG TPA: hypothetical protein VNF73_04130 [Candidatus Saccharimonadales bacterium]|nr:hypothetical protein [Candidatus Saccharimonadales bacterium]
MASDADESQPERSDHDPAGTITQGARRAADSAREVVGEIASRMPEASASTRDLVEQANVQMRASSDEMLIAGAGLSLGLTLGLMVAGANRLLVALAFVPAAAIGATLKQRRGEVHLGGRRSRRPSSYGLGADVERAQADQAAATATRNPRGLRKPEPIRTRTARKPKAEVTTD